MSARNFLCSVRGAAAAEMALILPLLFILLFGGFEAGHYVWSHHKLVEAVRNGARFAGRMPVEEICDGADLVASPDRIAEIKLVTRTGQIADTGADPVVRGWTDSRVSVEFVCEGFVGTGIYSDLGGAGPVVTVAATGVSYPWLFPWFGEIGGPGPPLPPPQPQGDGTTGGLRMYAKASAAVVGI